MRRVTLILVAALAVAGCQKKSAVGGEPSPAMARAIAALPAQARIVLGIDVPKAAASPLVTQAITLMTTSDPALGKTLSALQARCGIEPARDVDAVVVGLADPSAQDQNVLIAVGRFKPDALVTCARATLAETGGTLDASGEHWVARQGPEGPAFYLAATAETVTLAGNPGWLAAPTGPTQAADYIAKTDTGALLWAAAKLTPEESPSMSPQKIRGLYGQLRSDEGLEIRSHFELESPSDAKAFRLFLEDRTGQFSQLAAADGLDSAAPSIKIEQEDNTVRIRIGLSGEQVRQLEARLAKQPEPQPEPEPVPEQEHRNEPAEDAAASGEREVR